jgi:hypothetical protein
MEVKSSNAVSLLTLLIVCAAATAAFLAVRFYLVEPDAIAQGCAAVNEGWRCLLREWAVFGFLKNIFGMTALVTGLAATITRWRSLALLAIVSGIAGAVLYTFELSGVGFLLGALVWVHRSSKDRKSEQQTHGAKAQST